MFKTIVCAVSCGALLVLAACGEQEEAKPAAQKVEKKADTAAQKADDAAKRTRPFLQYFDFIFSIVSNLGMLHNLWSFQTSSRLQH